MISLLLFLIFVIYIFFLGQSGKIFISFINLFKEPNFSFIDLLFCFSSLSVTDFRAYLHYIFPSACFGCGFLFLLSSSGSSGPQHPRMTLPVLEGTVSLHVVLQ